MRLPAATERKILRLHGRGLDAVAIACELLIDWAAVERVLVEAGEDDDETAGTDRHPDSPDGASETVGGFPVAAAPCNAEETGALAGGDNAAAVERRTADAGPQAGIEKRGVTAGRDRHPVSPRHPQVDPLAKSEAFLRRRPATAPQLRGVAGRAVLPEDLLTSGRPLALLRGRR